MFTDSSPFWFDLFIQNSANSVTFHIINKNQFLWLDFAILSLFSTEIIGPYIYTSIQININMQLVVVCLSHQSTRKICSWGQP